MRRVLPWIFGLAIAVALWSLIPDPGARSSALSRAPGGWWGLRAYLEDRGVSVTLLDAPLEETAPPEGVLVLSLPWQLTPSEELENGLRRHLRAGGALLLAYDGGEVGFIQERLYGLVGLEPSRELRPAPPLSPKEWWRHQREIFTLEGRGEHRNTPDLEIPAFRWLPAAPQDAETLFALPAAESGGESTPVVFRVERHGGEVVLLPASLFANASLRRAGNAELVEALLAHHGGAWAFDEYHHGLVRPDLVRRSEAARSWDLFAWHLLVLYGLGLFALARPFGPVWREPPMHSGSTTDFLHHLGAQHDALGHHREAAQHLLEHARRLRPDFTPPAQRPEEVAGAADLVRLAAALEEKNPNTPSPGGPSV